VLEHLVGIFGNHNFVSAEPKRGDPTSDWPADTPMTAVARDGAGNEVTAEFWHKVFPKKFRSRDLPLEDSFVQKVVPEIMAHTHDIKDQGDPVKTFVEINSTLRRMNHETIAKLAKQSPGQFLWNGPFLQLSNSKVEAFFADRRSETRFLREAGFLAQRPRLDAS